MNHPPYHLRMNKAVDRFLLVDTLRIFGKTEDLSAYTYFGFGGPFLEDCRLIHEYCPEIKLVSIETNRETYKRQLFHRFTKSLTLKNENFGNFLTNYESKGKEIFWLDYTDLKFTRFEEFSSLLSRAANGCIVRITLRADIPDNPYLKTIPPESPQFREALEGLEKRFRNEFEELLPGDFSERYFRPGEIPILIQKMLRIAAERTLSGETDSRFLPLNSTFYNDGTPMISVCGIVCDSALKKRITPIFRKWKFANLDWNMPDKIDVPILSVKERFLLEPYLPIKSNTGKLLAKCLKYKIADGREAHLRKMTQFSDFCNCYPNFAKISV